MAGSRRARTGRGWDAAIPRTPARERAGAARTFDRADARDPAERAREICLRQLAVRPRTQLELAAALRRQHIPDDVAADVLARYGEVGIVDDEAFARAWVTSRHHGKGLARRALAGELRRKGVADDTLGAALDEVSTDTEAGTARALVERKLRAERPGTPEATLRRLVGLLARKGYPPALAFRVVREAMAARAVDEPDMGDSDALEAAALEADDLDPEREPW